MATSVKPFWTPGLYLAYIRNYTDVVIEEVTSIEELEDARIELKNARYYGESLTVIRFRITSSFKAYGKTIGYMVLFIQEYGYNPDTIIDDFIEEHNYTESQKILLDYIINCIDINSIQKI